MRSWITGSNRKVLAARSNVISWNNLNQPSQGRLALTKKVGEMSVIWTSGQIATAQTVKLGTSSSKYTVPFAAAEVKHEASDMCGSPATGYGWRSEGKIWHAVVTGLTPNTVYFYTYGSDVTGWSKESHFRVMPESSKMTSTKIGIVGDQGIGSKDSTSDRRNGNSDQSSFDIEDVITMLNNHVDDMESFFLIGDVSYAQGFAAEWEIYHDQMRHVAERIPFMTVTGNHEADWPGFPGMRDGWDSTGECNGAYEKRYGQFMPKGTTDKSVQWYSWNQGPVHVIALSTEHDTGVGSVQNKWLKKDLQSVDRSVTPWVIVGTHRPLYAKRFEDKQAIADLEPLLYQYKVDVLYAGHLHTYQRFCPMLNNKCMPGATTHVLVGSAGAGFHSTPGAGPNSQRPGGSTAAGVAMITANRTHYVHEYVNLHNKVEDRFVLKLGYNSGDRAPYNYTMKA